MSNIDYTNEKAISWIKNYFGFPKENKIPQYRILWLGEYIKTNKGKTVWETPGRARSAWINFIKNNRFVYHLDKELTGLEIQYWDKYNGISCDELIKQHLAAGLVSFPKVE